MPAAASAVLLISWCVRVTCCLGDGGSQQQGCQKQNVGPHAGVVEGGNLGKGGEAGQAACCGNMKCELRQLVLVQCAGLQIAGTPGDTPGDQQPLA